LLALDDEESLADVIDIGERAGFDVSVAVSAAPFKEALAAHTPDVIMLDLQMPDMDGVEIMRFLATHKARAGIVLVSGMDLRTISSAQQLGRGRGLNVVGTLQKPFTEEDLLQRLQAAKAATQAITAEDLMGAIERSELAVHYQPTARRFADGTWDIYSVEALLRWQHPERGLIGPDAFLQIGETHGLIRSMTDFVLQRGVEQLKGWRASHLDLGLRVNVAATLISDLGFPDRLQSFLTEQQIDPSSLTVEITETAMLEQHVDTLDILTRLRVKGMNLAIDDFGTGYSSLTQLVRMPFNEMKIDKSLILEVPHTREANAVVDALVKLGHTLNLTVCAEGVETPEALEFLNSVRCDCVQGFLIGRPVPAKDIPEVVHQWTRRQSAHSARLAG
jgi:EAL domain-containing protein (putative c-di-GMP-specific phosphodiesterase class I)/CheY-like chemotaxis protein